MALMGFGDFSDMFGHVDRMMSNIMRIHADPFGMMEPMMPMPGLTNMAGPSFVSSSSVVITSDGSGRPQVYQSTRTARYGPGGVAETQETVKDSASGLQRMAIGHHINDRGHVMEKSKNWYTGEEEEKDELINLDEEEQQSFEDEWRNRMYSQQHRGYHGDRALIAGQASSPLAITAGPSTSGESNSSHYYPQQSRHPSQYQNQHQNQYQHQHQHHQHQHPHLHQHRAYSHPPHHRSETSSANSRCDPDIEIISGPGRSQPYHDQPVAGTSQQSASRHRFPSKQRSKKDKKPYKRSSKNADQQH